MIASSSTLAPPEALRRPTLRGIPDLIALLFAIPAGIILLVTAQSGTAVLSGALFSLGLVLLLATSGLYHAVSWSPRRLALMSRLDHSAIFVLIGTSYTPFCLCTDLPLGPHLLGVVWAASLVGVAHCLFFPGAHRTIRATLYVVLGVAMVPCTPSLFGTLPTISFVLSALGGASYITGAVVYVKRWPNPWPKHFGYHEVMHLFIFGGAICHYTAIWHIIT